MDRQDERELDPRPEAEPVSEKRPYETPRVESVRLSKEAAESLT
jgi:hypothetical protein